MNLAPNTPYQSPPHHVVLLPPILSQPRPPAQEPMPAAVCKGCISVSSPLYMQLKHGCGWISSH